MVENNSSKTYSRLEARLSPEIKALWQLAASLEGVTLTDFVISSVQEAARKVIEKHQTIRLNLEESEAFVNALSNPPEPNEALKKAAERYKRGQKTN